MSVVLQHIEALTKTGAYRLRLAFDGRLAEFTVRVESDKGQRYRALEQEEELARLLVAHEREELGLADVSRYLCELFLLMMDAHDGRDVRLPFTFGTDPRCAPRRYWWQWWKPRPPHSPPIQGTATAMAGAGTAG